MRAVWMLALCWGCSGTAGPEPVEPTPDLSVMGPSSVKREDLTANLGDRGAFPSSVAFRLYSPRGMTEAASVVVVSHAFNVGIEQYHTLATHLASWGLVAVVPTWDAGSANPRAHADLATDAVLMLDWLQANPLPFDVAPQTERFGLVGHARGGKQSVHAAILDARVRAVVGLDPVDAAPALGGSDAEAYPSVTPELMEGLSAPAIVLGLGLGATGEPPCAPADEGYAAFAGAMKEGSLSVVLPASGHNDVLDACADGRTELACLVCPGGEEPAVARSVAHALTTGFLLRYLRDDLTVEPWIGGAALTEAFPAVEVHTQGQGDAEESDDSDADETDDSDTNDSDSDAG